MAAVIPDHTLGLTGGAGRIQNIQGVGGGQRNAVRRGGLGYFLYPVQVPAGDHIGFGHGALKNQGLFRFGIGKTDRFIQQGLGDAILGREAQVPLDEYGPKLDTFIKAKVAETAGEEKKAGLAFLEKMAAEPGATKTDSGMVYFELAEGTGASPTGTDQVKVHYHGTLRDGSVLGNVVTEKCVACKLLTRSDCHLTSAQSTGDGSVEWHLITGHEGSLGELIENLRKVGCVIELKSTKRIETHAMLTKRQEEIIHYAVDHGYYDHPKRTTIKKLARHFDISPSTLAEILQRSEKKIICSHFHDE